MPVPFRRVGLYVSLPAGTHVDATNVQLVQHFVKDGCRPDWAVIGPLYRDALLFLKIACHISKVGVTFVLRVIFWSRSLLRPSERLMGKKSAVEGDKS